MTAEVVEIHEGQDVFRVYPELLDAEYVKEYDFDACWTRNNETYLDRDVIAALLVTLGNLSRAAQLVGRSRSSFGNYVARNRPIREFHEEVHQMTLDHIEELQKASALAGDGAAQRFVLTTLGKDRGYTTRAEATGAGGRPLMPGIIVTADTDPRKAAEIYREMIGGE